MRIGIFAKNPDSVTRAESIAKQLGLCRTQTSDNFDYLLNVSSEQIELEQVGEKSKPLVIDFLSPTLTYRRKQASIKKEIVARALGLKASVPATIVDATAGLGRDSFILASLGFSVIMLERSPILSLLLEDGLHRAEQDAEVSPIIQRMQLIETNGITWLQSTTYKPDIIYLDPMFPERIKSALVKKEMRIFHDLIGSDPDAEGLLKAALTCATKRVVVKRPRLAETLGGIVPSFSMRGSSSRFDVYLI